MRSRSAAVASLCLAGTVVVACSSAEEVQGGVEGESLSTAAACAHAPCSTGGALRTSCDPCVAKVCAADSYCCSTGWDAQCTAEVSSVCGQACGSTACAHDVCTTGGKLAAACDSCATTVCAADPYCCSKGWNAQCVREAKQQCGACGVGAPDAAPPPPPPPAGTIGVNGGTVSQLLFGVVGDTRPATKGDTAGYPTDIISSIFQAVAARSPMPPIVVSTGDYNFSSTGGSDSAAQFDLYASARSKYPGAWFPTMGNHECTGYTNSNCGSGNADGVTSIYSNYLSKLLGPIQKTLPYYSIRVDATDGSWTSKFVFVAANAWTTTQATWLAQALAVPTTYTFVVRHEASDVTQAPGVTPSESIMASHPLTLSIVGHDHTYRHSGTELLVGNGGAPLTENVPYGYAVVERRDDGAIAVDVIDVGTGAPDASFHFAVHADGTPATP